MNFKYLVLICFFSTNFVIANVRYLQGLESSDLDFSQPRTSTLSPDSKHLYVVSESQETVKVLDYHEATGYISLLQTVNDAFVGNLMNFPQKIVFNPAGTYGYLINQGGAIIKLNRDANPASANFGELTYDSGGTTTPAGIVVLRSITIADNGSDVYVGGRFGSKLAHYKINVSNGRLVFIRDYINGQVTGSTTISGLGGAETTWLSEDQAYLYVATFDGNSIVVFQRASDGSLTFLQKLENGTGGLSGFTKVSKVVGYTNGSSSYVLASGGSSNDKMFLFSRNTSNGVLTFQGSRNFFEPKIAASRILNKFFSCNNSGFVFSFVPDASDPTGLRQDSSYNNVEVPNCSDLSFAPNGLNLVQSASTSNNIASFRVNEALPGITPLLAYPTGNVTQLRGTSAIAGTLDPHVYVTGSQSNSILTFNRQSSGKLVRNQPLTYIDDGVSVDGLSSVQDIVVTQDGEHVYTAGFGDNGIGFFTRNTNPASSLFGNLIYQTIYKNGLGGITNLSGVYDLALSTDENQNYLIAASIGSNSLNIYQRALNGTLTQIQTLTQTSGIGTIHQPSEIHVDDESTKVFVVSFGANRILEYNFNLGTLSFNQEVNAIGQPTSMALITDASASYNNSFYVYSASTSEVIFYRRSATMGTYTREFGITHPQFSGICALRTTLDYTYLVVTCRNTNSLIAFRINPDFTLTPNTTFQNLTNLVIGLGIPRVPTFSPVLNPENLGEFYVPADGSNGLSVFEVQTDSIFSNGFE